MSVEIEEIVKESGKKARKISKEDRRRYYLHGQLKEQCQILPRKKMIYFPIQEVLPQQIEQYIKELQQAFNYQTEAILLTPSLALPGFKSQKIKDHIGQKVRIIGRHPWRGHFGILLKIDQAYNSAIVKVETGHEVQVKKSKYLIKQPEE